MAPQFTNEPLPTGSMTKTCAACKLQLPDDDAVNLVTKEDTKTEGTESTQKTAYISTNYPSSQARYLSVTKLVMKALSVETISDITKPMFYGDVINGYCMNKIFKISDTNARGSERKYALMVASDSESGLLLNWDVVSMYMNEIITLIQAQVEETKQRKDSTEILDNERYLRRNMIKPRSLVELTNDKNIFVKFHLWAIEMLKDILR